MEHITTEEAVEFCKAQGDNVAMTFTPQHILLNPQRMLIGGIRPHLFCLPILKRESHHRGGDGGDVRFANFSSAPTPRPPEGRQGARAGARECSRARRAPVLRHGVQRRGKLENLEAFASHNDAGLRGEEKRGK